MAAFGSTFEPSFPRFQNLAWCIGWFLEAHVKVVKIWTVLTKCLRNSTPNMIVTKYFYFHSSDVVVLRIKEDILILDRVLREMQGTTECTPDLLASHEAAIKALKLFHQWVELISSISIDVSKTCTTGSCLLLHFALKLLKSLYIITVKRHPLSPKITSRFSSNLLHILLWPLAMHFTDQIPAQIPGFSTHISTNNCP